MTVLSAITLLVAMLLLAALPSSSVALVVARSATHGFKNGVAVSLGIVLGDLLFVLLAVLGMSYLAELMGSFFVVLRIFGGVYLLWLGIQLLRSKPGLDLPEASRSPGSLFLSFSSGFFLTLGDVKAIVFYASFFPAFVDLDSLAGIDLLWIGLITVFAVGGTKLVYAYFADRIFARLQRGQGGAWARRSVGAGLLAAGGWLIAKP